MSATIFFRKNLLSSYSIQPGKLKRGLQRPLLPGQHTYPHFLEVTLSQGDLPYQEGPGELQSTANG